MIIELQKFLIESIERTMKDNPEGVFFYMFGSLIMTIVLIKNNKDFKIGLKGVNGLWEPSEIVIYLWVWMFTQSILGVLFLKLTPPDMFWIFMLLCLVFAIAGRDGVQMLFNWRGSSTTIIQKETNTNENKDS